VFDPATRMGTAAVIPDLHARTSTMIDFDGEGAPLLALGGDSSLALVGDWERFPEPCVELLDEPADELAAGDRDGDGRQELAVLREGAIRLLHLP
jgi:hypothetical protein